MSQTSTFIIIVEADTKAPIQNFQQTEKVNVLVLIK